VILKTRRTEDTPATHPPYCVADGGLETCIAGDGKMVLRTVMVAMRRLGVKRQASYVKRLASCVR
jgi:hypothetical protein